jgi:hypothetical protein
VTPLTRREFLCSAGGVTFLALTPAGRGLFAAPGAALPRFTALPYVQPGTASRLVDGQESLVIAWQTEARPADFRLDYGPTRSYGRTAPAARAGRWQGAAGSDRRFNYAATLTGLALGRRYFYRLRGGGRTVAEGYLTTRQGRGRPIRFVAFGDNAYGDPGEKAVACHAYRQSPDFILNTGDNVYESGLDSEYARYFFPVYNADAADPAVGAPLLRSVPFYTVLANHDVHHKDGAGHPAADFDEARDSLGYYTAMHLPRNGPAPSPTPLAGDPRWVGDFRACAGPRYPHMANYSFDCGDAHFLCLDSNVYVDPAAPALRAWIEADLAATDAPWKFVVYHHPAFNVGDKHYKEQQMRVLSPLLEAHGVDVCLHGHEHVYQRTKPLRFRPTDTAKAGPAHGSDRRIPGVFTIDEAFDGHARTRPDGILYITTGAGGKELYDPDLDDTPARWLHADDGDVAYNARFVSRAHSFTVFDVAEGEITMRQIDEAGHEIDRIRVTKA